MQFELYLIRHGHAERHHPDGDSQRRLTDEGRATAVQTAMALAKNDHSFNAILTSPFVRARETADAYARATDYEGEIQTWPGLVPSGFAEESVSEILKRGRSMPDGSKLAVFSHNPHITTLTSLLIADHRDSYFNIRPGDVVHLLVPEAMPFKKPGEGPSAIVLGFYPAPLVCALAYQNR